MGHKLITLSLIYLMLLGKRGTRLFFNFISSLKTPNNVRDPRILDFYLDRCLKTETELIQHLLSVRRCVRELVWATSSAAALLGPEVCPGCPAQHTGRVATASSSHKAAWGPMAPPSTPAALHAGTLPAGPTRRPGL